MQREVKKNTAEVTGGDKKSTKNYVGRRERYGQHVTGGKCAIGRIRGM